MAAKAVDDDGREPRRFVLEGATDPEKTPASPVAKVEAMPVTLGFEFLSRIYAPDPSVEAADVLSDFELDLLAVSTPCVAPDARVWHAVESWWGEDVGAEYFLDADDDGDGFNVHKQVVLNVAALEPCTQHALVALLEPHSAHLAGTKGWGTLDAVVMTSIWGVSADGTLRDLSWSVRVDYRPRGIDESRRFSSVATAEFQPADAEPHRARLRP